MGVYLGGNVYLRGPRMVTGPDHWLIAFITRDTAGASAVQEWASQGGATRRTYYAIRQVDGVSKQCIHSYESGDSAGVVKQTAPHPNATAFQLACAQFSIAARAISFGDGVIVSQAGSRPDDTAVHTYSMIGAGGYGGEAVAGYVRGSMAEVWWGTGSLTQAQIEGVIAGTIKPEDLPGRVDGLPLLEASVNDTYLSFMGQVFTRFGAGAIATSPIEHPVNRTVPGVTIACSVGNAVAEGKTATITQLGNTTISCSVGNAAAAGKTATVKTSIVGGPFINNGESKHVNQSVVWTWTAGARIGTMSGLLAQDGVGTIDGTGMLITTIPYAPGRLDVAVRRTNAATDDIYSQAVL